jgi:AraC-like DNA-binding protein
LEVCAGSDRDASVIEIALEVDHTRPSDFVQVFRWVVAVTPMEFRSAM